MSVLIKKVSTIEYGANFYPAAHWKHLSRFATGEERDPRGLFLLTDDKWDAWPYALNGMPSQARKFRFNFSRLQTFIKLYVKWYCYHNILGTSGNLPSALPNLPLVLGRTDGYISEHSFRSIDDISPSTIFQDLWDAQIRGSFLDRARLPSKATAIQQHTRTFWLRMKLEFGSPHKIPPIAPFIKVKPAEFAADRRKIIPEHVIRQLTNKLGLHREKKDLLNRYDHLRLCVLMLCICLGRRANEILLSPRGIGSDGPLSRHPSKTGSMEGSLWFQFLPNKKGITDKVFISPEWEDIALYCVHELVKYSDEIRHLAAPEERRLLILVSRLNWTYGLYARSKPPAKHKRIIKCNDSAKTSDSSVNYAYLLDSENYKVWLNGCDVRTGVLELWGITSDGSTNGPVYRLLLSYTRHTRHSALALDPQTSLVARQRDLNHQDRDGQFAYQHRLLENNDTLLNKIKEGKLLGRGVEWLSVLLEVDISATPVQSSYKPGCPSPMTPRMLLLIKNNPMFLQLNRVPGGICMWPQGPGGCAEYLNCTSASEGGCHSFFLDVDDVQMLKELTDKAEKERRMYKESETAGRTVQAQKRAIPAHRTEELRNESMRRSSKETLLKLRRMQSEIEEQGL